MQYALGVAEVGPDKVFVDLNEFGFVVTEAVVDLGADGLVTAVPRRLTCEISDEAVEAAGTRAEIAGVWTFICTGIQCGQVFALKQ